MQQHATITDASSIHDADLGSIWEPRRRPIHKMLVAFSIAYFLGALATDMAYWQMPDVMWERFSIWLIVAGLIAAGLGVIAYAIDVAEGRQIDRPALPRVIGYAVSLVLAVTNAFVHSRDGYTAVVPTGLMLSGLVVVVLVLTGLTGMALARRQRIGG